MNKRYSIADGDCKVEIRKFYENAARISGYSVTDKTTFDCRKICVSKPVEKLIHDEYRKANLTDEQIGAIWVMFGPKANLDSDEPIFEIENGFATER